MRKAFRRLLIVSVVAAWAAAPPAHAASNAWESFKAAAAGRHGDLGRQAAAFLETHAPPADRTIDLRLLNDNLDHALRARSAFAWAKQLPEDRFFNDVLPYAVLDETRENWRPRLYEVAREIVRDARTATEAAQALNRELFDKVGVHYDTTRHKPNQGPFESIEQGKASCTGLSILLVDACRAVGIPARVAGVAEWVGKEGNHTWVEVWDGKWHYVGADEYDPAGLDRAWFTADAARAIPDDPQHAVWASSWRKTDHHFPLAWNPQCHDVPGVDVTSRYAASPDSLAQRSVRYLRVWDRKGGQRIAARVRALDSQEYEFASVVTRDGRADLNDMPAVALEPNTTCKLVVEHNDKSRIAWLETQPGHEQTTDLYWDQLGLTSADAEQLLQQKWAAVAEDIRTSRATEMADGAFQWQDHTLRIRERTFGEPPPGGHSLWISMHGGGGAPTEVNDQQWENQLKLYEPAEGIYIAPRAPTDTWNLWHQAHMDPLFDRLIETYVACRGVNPDRVYLLGYSAGGDGVYQLAPRMADRFAAAAMMAGHPNEASPLGLRNLPFAIYAGGQDTAYKRNEVAVEWGRRLEDLHLADPAGYPFRVTIYPQCAHWMNKQDASALPWMAAHVRNPWPNRIVWCQDDVTHTRFYWLSIAPEDAMQGRTITATVDGQTIRIQSTDVSAVTLHLRDTLLDLDQPVTIVANNRTLHHGPIPRTETAITQSLTTRADPQLAGTAHLGLKWP